METPTNPTSVINEPPRINHIGRGHARVNDAERPARQRYASAEVKEEVQEMSRGVDGTQEVRKERNVREAEHVSIADLTRHHEVMDELRDIVSKLDEDAWKFEKAKDDVPFPSFHDQNRD